MSSVKSISCGCAAVPIIRPTIVGMDLVVVYGVRLILKDKYVYEEKEWRRI